MSDSRNRTISSDRLHPVIRAGLIATAIALSLYATGATVGAATGDTTTLLPLPAGHRPEGIAVRQTGEIFVGDRDFSQAPTRNRILRITPGDGTAVFAELPESSPGAQGLLGLAVDPPGNVYAAFASFDANHGVWRVSPDGSTIERLDASGDIAFPNALAFDRAGNLYVTDSLGGTVWRSRQGGRFTRWITDPLLAPLPTNPFGVALPGANGIAFVPPDRLYVANTERGLIAVVPILPDGSAGAVHAVTAAFAVPTVDGIAVDAHGRIYGALPGFSLLTRPPLVRIDPDTGEVNAVVTDPADMSRFDTPVSLAFAGGRWGGRRVVVTNADLPIAPGGAGPGVAQVEVGAPGVPGW